MKYLMQGMAMFSDIIIGGMACVGIYAFFTVPSILVKGVIILLLFAAYNTWKNQGGFIAWTKEGRTKFYTGWDEITKCEKEL